MRFLDFRTTAPKSLFYANASKTTFVRKRTVSRVRGRRGPRRGRHSARYVLYSAGQCSRSFRFVLFAKSNSYLWWHQKDFSRGSRPPAFWGGDLREPLASPARFYDYAAEPICNSDGELRRIRLVCAPRCKAPPSGD
ncbi:hypothetical protein EVAR_36615_1 [Eumeta japonica]|uniref:Uncharacterized protein n=1 Tax=Eumeta variegata TaxID=151549 RepID=A0A4C1ZM93_EUMVA|nr:hypothetical protein EVAR_36615_1 [Eumeta japonica]